ncbi:MAG: carboxy terminal-processing peptidase [Bacteroidota bacterium]|nr:carboxy terminal-processing peptidase [Bacteroidota bacterium]
MKSTKGLLVLAVVLFGGLFFAFSRNGGGNDYITQKQKLLVTISQLLEQQHYSPKKLDDNFSKQVFKKYLEDLYGNEDKNLFLQSDIDALKKYETTIDDEMNGADLKFVPAVSAIYDKRVAEAVTIYKQILSKPFDFAKDETITLDADKAGYPANDAERRERWRKKLKYLTLERYADLQDQRSKSSVDSIKTKTDAQLEKEAREKVSKAVDKIFERIKVKFTEDERFNTFINTITNLMDPHTDYFPPVEKRAFDEMMSNRFYGIGAQLMEQDGQIKIANVTTGGPAWKSGELMSNDIILKVAQGKEEPVDITGYDVTDAVKLIRGNQGTEVRLTIKKQDGTIKVISLIRDEIVLDESFARSVIIKNGDEKIGYIFLPDFYADFERKDGAHCSEDVAKEIIKLKAEGVKGIVLDLRFNGGGSLYEVVQMVGLFIGQGPVVQVRDKDGRASVLPVRDNGVLYDGPLAVMVNEGSASASEIFAAAIQDYKRGIIIGSSSTYGKGTVQKTVPLGKVLDYFSGRTEYGAVKLTFQKFYRVNGGSTQLKGVIPDIVLPDAYDYLKIREKDNPSALPWDEIAKSPIQPWDNHFDIASLIKKENQSIDSDVKFKLIKENTQWIAKNSDAPQFLNITKYRQQQKLLSSTVNQNSTLTKLSAPMNVNVLKADYEKFFNNPDKAKGDRYQAWLKSMKNDLYIDESIKIVSDMIHAQVETASK